MINNFSTISQFFNRPQPAATGTPLYQAASRVPRMPVQQGLVFIIMSFDGMNDVHEAFREQCSSLGLTAKRADDPVGGGFVMPEVDRLIRQAELIICDLSYERPRAGCQHAEFADPLRLALTRSEDGHQQLARLLLCTGL